MKKKSIYFLILVFSTLLQTSVLPVLFGVGSVGDNVLMLILAWSVLDGFASFLGFGILAGIFYDMLSFSTIGTHAIIFLGVIYFVSFFSRRFSVEVRGTGIILLLLFIIVATIFSHAVVVLVMAFEANSLDGYWRSFGTPGSFLLSIAYNIVLFAFWFHFIRKIKKFFLIEA